MCTTVDSEKVENSKFHIIEAFDRYEINKDLIVRRRKDKRIMKVVVKRSGEDSVVLHNGNKTWHVPLKNLWRLAEPVAQEDLEPIYRSLA